jgi:mannose/fructose/N-acetylgalactosamine-specific phosphotransferase system component IIB
MADFGFRISDCRFTFGDLRFAPVRISDFSALTCRVFRVGKTCRVLQKKDSKRVQILIIVRKTRQVFRGIRQVLIRNPKSEIN